MSGSDVEARGLTITERGMIAVIINKWERAAGGSYDEDFIRCLMKFALDTRVVLDLFELENQNKKPAEDA